MLAVLACICWLNWLVVFYRFVLGLFKRIRDDVVFPSISFDLLSAFPLFMLIELPALPRIRLLFEIVDILLDVCSSTTESIAFLLGTVLKLHDVTEEVGVVVFIDWFLAFFRTCASRISRFRIFIWDYSSRFWVFRFEFSFWRSDIVFMCLRELSILFRVYSHSEFLFCIVEKIVAIIAWI